MTEEQLAALIEGGLDGSEAREARAHLTGCRTCLAAYADAVHLRAHWRQDNVSSARAVVDARSRFRPRGSTWILAACLALLVAAGAWLGVRSLRFEPVAPHPAFEQVARAVAAASHDGMILPGCAGAAWNPPELVFRSGDPEPDLATALAALRDLPADEAPADLRALRVAGELAAGNLHMADILLGIEAPSASEDPQALLLAGILAYRENDLATSERFLARALDLAPGHPETRFNLALVLVADGRRDEARRILADLAAREDLPLLHYRAEAELARLDS